MIIRDFDDMRIGTTPLSKLYYGHDLIWKRKDGDSDTLIITTTYTNTFTIPSINSFRIIGTVDFGDGESSEYDNTSIIHNYPYSDSWKIKIKAPFTSIKSSAFDFNLKINSIILPKGVNRIEERAFNNCKNLKSITISNSVTSIKLHAFYGCSSLTSVAIPDSVTGMGNAVFQNCTSLTSVVISNSLTRISPSTFDSCTSLTSITIPDSVTSIGSYAFYSCTSLTSITIPDSVTGIEERAFSRCSSLTSITIPPSVKNIQDYVFADTKLTSVTIASDCALGYRVFPTGCVINRY